MLINSDLSRNQIGGNHMPKHILVISTSPRKGGNSETLANEFIRGAKESGNQVEKVCLYDKTISFCKGMSDLPENQNVYHP